MGDVNDQNMTPNEIHAALKRMEETGESIAWINGVNVKRDSCKPTMYVVPMFYHTTEAGLGTGHLLPHNERLDIIDAMWSIHRGRRNHWYGPGLTKSRKF